MQFTGVPPKVQEYCAFFHATTPDLKYYVRHDKAMDEFGAEGVAV
jgi:hypothetical protein